MSIKISALELENVKRVKAVSITPNASGLTVIGGNNGEGKTSILDAIAWGLGGDRLKPSTPWREDSVIPPSIHLELSNGMIVERKGKNSDLKVIDPQGNKSGQQLLNEFVEQFALNLPKFMASTGKEKANALLQIIGVGDKLHALEQQEAKLYNRRHELGRIAEQKAHFAEETQRFPDAPNELVSAMELIEKQQDILGKNGENQKKRGELAKYKFLESELRRKLSELQEEYDAVCKDLAIASQNAEDLQDESTAELEQSIRDVEETNRKVRANLSYENAKDEAVHYRNEYDKLSSEINTLRGEKMSLLQNAKLPLPELSVEDGELTYKGYCWDGMSGSEQLKVSAAIVRALKPSCGFVLLDKLEQMDMENLEDFGHWMEAEGLQGIATRVSTGDECSIIIEDGYATEVNQKSTAQNTWKAGEF